MFCISDYGKWDSCPGYLGEMWRLIDKDLYGWIHYLDIHLGHWWIALLGGLDLEWLTSVLWLVLWLELLLGCEERLI